MKERAVMLLAALGALAISLTIFVRGENGIAVNRADARPTTQERGPNGYRAALEWLSADRIPALSMREEYTKLDARRELARTGNLLIVTLPAANGFRQDEFPALDRWLRTGNGLLVLAGLPASGQSGSGGLAAGDLTALTGLVAEEGPVVARGGAAESVVPNGSHAYFDGVASLKTKARRRARRWSMRIPPDAFVLVLARDENGAGVLWTRDFGNGRVIVSTADLFSNGALGAADNARLFANIVSANLRPGGSVLFDDLHQGLTAGYDPQEFYKDPRLYFTVGILVALWLTWVVGSLALRVPDLSRAVPRETELVRATGRFFARVLHSSVGARRMFDLFFGRVDANAPSTRGDGQPPWEAVERHLRVDPAVLRQLQVWYADAQASRRVPLDRLHNLLRQVDLS
jgi:hypothetical protein